MWFEGHKLVQMIAQDKRKHDEQVLVVLSNGSKLEVVEIHQYNY